MPGKMRSEPCKSAQHPEYTSSEQATYAVYGVLITETSSGVHSMLRGSCSKLLLLTDPDSHGVYMLSAVAACSR